MYSFLVSICSNTLLQLDPEFLIYGMGLFDIATTYTMLWIVILMKGEA